MDFNQFYSAGKLAGSGRLYDWDALRKIETENGTEVVLSRLPVVVYGFKIFNDVPFARARFLWMAASIAAAVIFAIAWPGVSRPLMFTALAWSLPLTMVLVFGQDIAFWLMFFAVGLRLMEKRPAAAGVVFSLCICKFHLALGIPVMLAAQRRWRTLVAGTIAFSILIGLCFWIEGRDWPVKYWNTSQRPDFSHTPARMPNLHGLVSWLPLPGVWEITGAVAVLVLLWIVVQRGEVIGTAGAAAAACGLLIGHHSYLGDCALLIPISVVCFERRDSPPWLQAGCALMLSPVPGLLLVSGNPIFGQAMIVVFALCATFWVAQAGKRRDSAGVTTS